YRFAPLNFQDWYDFVFAAVSRYKDDIFLWGVWNEPNLDVYLDGADLRTYRTLAVMAHAAIRAANPNAVVIGPDVSWHGVKDGWFAAAMNDFGSAITRTDWSNRPAFLVYQRAIAAERN